MKKYTSLRFVLIVASLLFCMFGGYATSSATTQHPSSMWDGSGQIRVIRSNEELSGTEANQLENLHMGAHGRQTCAEKTVLIGDYEYADCWYQSGIGEFSDHGNVWLPAGAESAGYLGESANKQVIPTPNGMVLLEIVPVDGQHQLSFRRVADGAPSTIGQYGSEVYYDWLSTPASLLKHQNGVSYMLPISTRYIGMWYDEGGRYLLIVDQNVGSVLRVDLLTFNVLNVRYVDESEPYRFGVFDITSDGKKLLVNVHGVDPKIIHFDDCDGAEAAHVSEPLTCRETDFGAVLRTFTGEEDGYVTGEFARFKNDSTVELYLQSSAGDEKLYIYAPGTWQENRNYIALGDSFAAGEGAGDYYAGTDKYRDNMCHLSKKSYPFLLGQELVSTRSVACSGAVLRNVIGVKDSLGVFQDTDSSNQFNPNVRDSELDEWLPGVDMQTNYFNITDKPGIVTLSVGGNDIGFEEILTTCVRDVYDTCFDNESDREALVKRINKLQPQLAEAYAQVHKNAALGARVYAIGYPEAVVDAEHCVYNGTGSTPLNHEERKYLTALTRYLNLTIEHAAAAAGIVYVDISKSLYGHRLCELSLSPSSMNGLRLRLNFNDITDVVNQESFHPNALGHELMGDAIIEQTGYLTLNNPYPTYLEEITREDAVNIGVLESLWEPGETRVLQYTAPPNSILLHGSLEEFQLGGEMNLQAGGQYVLDTHSTPTRLDTAIADENGVVHFHFTVPENMEVGPHTFVVTGPNPDGGTLEIRMPYFVAYSYEDWDGDGIPNEEQACPYEVENPNTGLKERDWCIDENGESIFETPEKEDDEPVVAALPGEKVKDIRINGGGSTATDEKRELVINNDEANAEADDRAKRRQELDTHSSRVLSFLPWAIGGIAITLVLTCVVGIYYITHRHTND